jgi:hypothetical protein
MTTLRFFVRTTLLWCLALVLPGCVDPYLPDDISSAKSYLVVDGFINSRGISTIVLSRTYSIQAGTVPPKETRATVYIQDEGSQRFILQETTPGTYTSAALVLSPTKNYRLRIATTGGKEYASAYVQAKVTPVIDNVTWRTSPDGLNIYANAHDDNNATRYYRWEYEETWEIIPFRRPQLEFVNFSFRPITVPFPVICWGSETSKDIKQTKTTSLSRDVVSDYVLRTFSTTNERLRHRYSILVKQYAQTQEEYEYWDLLKKNTEDIGTLFDPLPVQLTGNVRCLSDETELALGYVGAHSVEQRRIFITRSELPATWNISTGYDNCTADTIKPREQRSVFSYPGNIPLYEVPGGILGTTRDCVDCRLRGTTVRPSFW